MARTPTANASSGRSTFTKVLKGLVYGALVGLLALGVAVAVATAYLPSYSDLTKRSDLGQMIRVRAANGQVLVSIGPSFGKWLPYDEIPAEMRAAMISTEDRRFRSHIGVDPIGIGRAIGSALFENHRVSATSTITQQLARNIFLTNNRSFGRKIKEGILALALERKFSKDQILELYLNRVYFGGGAYGIDAASRKFFGHGADHLSLGEAAIIAGLVKAPSNYSPTADIQAARSRSGVVLQTMARNGFISAELAAVCEPGRGPNPADHQQQQRALLHRLGASAAGPADRSDAGADRRLDDARPGDAGGRGSGDPRQRAGRRPGRARVDRPRRRGARDGRRQGLRRFDLQPGDPGDAPAGLRLQTVRLSRRRSNWG